VPIIGLQRRLREIGRLRLGETRQGRDGPYPAKLSTFRLTSPDRVVIDRAAELWGGQPSAWASPSGRQWQVTVEADALPCVVPTADMAFSQFYELWSGGGCQRRCDGQTELITDGPCLCDPDGRECAPTTRLNVLLTDLPGLGMWRLESHGFNAAVELAGVVAVLAAAAEQGQFLPARVRVEGRAVKRPGKNGKAETHRFVVPVLDLGLSLLSLGNAGGVGSALGTGETAAQPQIESSTPATSSVDPPLPDLEDGRQPVTRKAARPPRSIKDQVADLGEQEPRPPTVPLPDTGIEPSPAEQSETGVSPAARPAPDAPSPRQPGPADEGRGMAPSPSQTDPETMRRRIMAEARKTWPDAGQDEREDFRHALGVIATFTVRAAAGEPPVASVAAMTMDERTRLSTLMADVREGRMFIAYGEPTPEGHRTFRSWLASGKRTAVLVREAVDRWRVEVLTNEPPEASS
jgi:hypothetical protein